jgi:alpha-N-arabinofuranosidase
MVALPRRAGQLCQPRPPGFHADPSVCRAGSDYYLVTSSFEYFPGVPVYRSRDLVHWRQVGHALTRESQLKLEGEKSSKGIFAPTIRCHAGTFYMITSNIENGGDFYVHTRDPAGEWSEPVPVKQKEWSMDPSLFFDDDGKVYYTRHGGGRDGGVYQAEIDIATGKLAEEPKLVWKGTGGIWPEGPHLYKVNSTYYLLISEGGTSYNHSLTVARSKSPWGPFEANPDNPILTHRKVPDHPLQALGHADLVQTEAGAWWA